MRRVLLGASALAVAADHRGLTAAIPQDERAASNMRVWVDPATPREKQTAVSSRGQKWELVMSDEFNTVGRSFLPGRDHMWTALDKPDGVNDALEYYSSNRPTTRCEGNTCFLEIAVDRVQRKLSVYNEYSTPPRYDNITMYYESGMIQSWNKFCFQGGLVEVRAKLPGGVGKLSKNPDLQGPKSQRVKSAAFYPTWPGIWMMGNLGRALFGASTERMWPFSYNRCDPEIVPAGSQRISACNTSSEHGLNPGQGRGAPQIDIFDGVGLSLSSSLHIAPGMPTEFRIIPGDSPFCVYDASCKTSGANNIGVPTATYAKRGHQSWYQGLRYASNNQCSAQKNLTQSYTTIRASLDAGIKKNKCDLSTCPASLDINSDLEKINRSGDDRWGINANGTCFAEISGYTGALLCSLDNTDAECMKLRGSTVASTPRAAYKYHVDAISANWPIHLAAYTSFLTYQLEWVPGRSGYIRWMLEGQPIFEIPAEAITRPPQDAAGSNPVKLMPEEPMYLIMNVALSKTGAAPPPNAGRDCLDHGDETDPDVIGYNELICDQFPMSLAVDYIRVYQDVSAGSTMSIGCDPSSHPTQKWITNHIDEYEDATNVVMAVHGRAFCQSHDDCTLAGKANGECLAGRCKCADNWTGPRCSSRRSEEEPGFGYTSEVRSGGIAVAVVFGLAVLIHIVKRFSLCVFMKRQEDVSHTVMVAGSDISLAAYPREGDGRASRTSNNRDPPERPMVIAATPRTSFRPHLSPLRTVKIIVPPSTTNL